MRLGRLGTYAWVRRPFWGSVGSGRWGWVRLSVWGDLEKSVDLSRKAQKAVPVAFDGAIPPSTTGMAILDGAYRGLPFLVSP